MTSSVMAILQQVVTMHTLYDASSRPFRGWEIAAAGLVVALASLFVRRESSDHSLMRRGVRPAMLVFGIGWALVIGVGQWGEHARLRRAMRDGRFVVVEGTVYDNPRGDEGAGNWLVDTPGGTHWYRYTRSPLASGYVRRRPGGGGIHTGDRVRIADVDGRIARVDLARLTTR